MDLQKAHDSVRHLELLKAIMHEYVDVRVVWGLLSSHLGTKLNVKLEEFQFMPTLLRGIRQGLIDPAYLCIISIDCAMTGVIKIWDHGRMGLRIFDAINDEVVEHLVHHIQVSDDGTYFGEFEEQLEPIFQGAIEVLFIVGLEANWIKSSWMCSSDGAWTNCRIQVCDPTSH